MIRVLLAEDNPSDIFLVEEALKLHQIDYVLHVVKDGAQALEHVARMGQPGKTPCPDVLLMDMNLPKADGPEILAAFRNHGDCTRTPVIVVSSSSSPQERARMEQLGVSEFFRKPSDFDEFMKLGALIKNMQERNEIQQNS